MKKLLLPLLLFSAYFLSAQEEQNYDLNKWSVEATVGMHKPVRPVASGHFTDTPSFGQYSLGARYMINNRFGLKVDFGYSTLNEGDNSQPFKANYYRTSLQGVANIGSILGFETWTNTIGLLAHAGGGYSLLSPKEPIDIDDNDQMLNLIVGITPQIRLTDRLALTTDLSMIGNIRQDYTFDGTGTTNTRGFDGYMFNVSAGLTFYLGKNEKHVDWAPQDLMVKEKLDDIDNRLSKVETDLIDTDQDGVPDYLDREPNTISGATVNTKGVAIEAIDKSNNGITDELKSALDQRYAKKDGGVEGLLNNGYVNLYFKFNTDEPETYSLNAINYLTTYMKENPSVNAELIGYADELGSSQYNQTLSEKRAVRVYEILIASGVDKNRLTYRGGGVDSTVDKSSEPARQLVRRVTFKLK